MNQVPGPAGCRRRQPVDISALYIDQLRVGAAEPDFTDGDSSSKHSWNPRYDRSLEQFIRSAYPGEIASNDVIVAGGAPEAIREELKKVEEIKRDLLAGACPDRFLAFARFYRALGRLSHYVSDVHSPFHANSFGLRDSTGQLKANDYHEGVFDPFAGGAWVRGLWDRGLPGRLAHGYNETYNLGSAADIPGIPCSECEGGVLDVDSMARQAAERMDSYNRAQVGAAYSGYRGVIEDFIAAGPPWIERAGDRVVGPFTS